MSVPYVSSKTLWIGFDNIRSVTLKVESIRFLSRSIENLCLPRCNFSKIMATVA